ncbi:MAG: SDR family NAD(P)-dependent oxidoreductase [Bacteroidota bacterium]|nr:SDR family NAD(P)-dependent oxidoreductase [Bacteroidota bacterium]
MKDPKKIIIIGASSGIGKEVALLYAKRGDKVGITGRRDHLLHNIKSQYPDHIFASCFDVMGPDNITSIERLIQEMGGLDLLIYNSGYSDASKELRWETEHTTIKTNVVGMVEIINYAFNYFSKKGWGQIAITSSIAAIRGNSFAPAYSASKAFISNYAEGLQMKAGRLKKDITVTDIKAGFINTKETPIKVRFWVASSHKAARQIVQGIDKKKRVLYVTKRWQLIAIIMAVFPFRILKRIV